ncbi:hypothetical protein ACH5AI_38295 [Streptomyces collinus]|uniref:hypothetical protein n=1 Tax=Streptomyces collinus TaxID=42684 RepID=UPI0037886335
MRGKVSLRHGCGVADLVRFRGVTTCDYKAARNRLGKARTDPAWVIALVRALLVLTNREVARWPTISTKMSFVSDQDEHPDAQSH